jgi:uncharacterized protein YndB with AHSA1/START domain
MPHEFTLTTIMPASAQEIYEAWLDSLAHSQMTGGEARTSDEIDADVSAWDGYITGRNLHLVPHARIVQSWRTTKFTEEHEDSVVTLSLEETEDGTLLTLVHSNVPDGQTSYQQGWETHYFVPMKAYFAKRKAPAKKRAPAKAKPSAAKGKVETAPSKRKAAKAAAAKSAPGKSAPANPASAKRVSAKSAPAKPAAKAGAKAAGPRAKPKSEHKSASSRRTR